MTTPGERAGRFRGRPAIVGSVVHAVRTLVWAAVLTCGGIGDARAQAVPAHSASREYNIALGVECEHCHSASDRGDDVTPTFDFARRMALMVRGLNEGPLGGRAGVTCWSCHRGRRVPARLPRTAWESLAATHAATFAGGPDGLEIAMSVYAASLGVDCRYCHVVDWTAATKPQHQAVAAMSAIFEVIPRYFDASVRTPLTQCYMCHQGRTVVERVPPVRRVR